MAPTFPWLPGFFCVCFTFCFFCSHFTCLFCQPRYNCNASLLLISLGLEVSRWELSVHTMSTKTHLCAVESGVKRKIKIMSEACFCFVTLPSKLVWLSWRSWETISLFKVARWWSVNRSFTILSYALMWDFPLYTLNMF